MGLGIYHSLRRKEVRDEQTEELKVQEEEISKELESFNNLQSLLTNKAEDLEVPSAPLS